MSSSLLMCEHFGCLISDFGGLFITYRSLPISNLLIPKSAIMEKKELQDRLKWFAVAIVKFSEELPDKSGFRTVRNQIVRCGPSAAANYRAACRAKSDADYISKMGIVEEELDETMFWLEFTVGLSEDHHTQVAPLWKEGDELLAIIVSSIITKKRNRKN